MAPAASVCAERCQACTFDGWEYGGDLRTVRSGAFSSLAGVRPWVIFAGGVSRLVRSGCCCHWHGRSLVALLRAAGGSSVGRSPISWSTRQLRCPRGVLPGRSIRGALVIVVWPGVGERLEWVPLRIAWGCHSCGSSVRALRVAGACSVPQVPLGRRGQLALVPRGSVWGWWASGRGGTDRQDVVSNQGFPDAEGRSVVPRPMQSV